MAEARKLEAEAQAYESKVQHEVHACMQRMLAELQLQQDQKLVAEVQEILQQETGFFLWKLIQAVKGRLHVMQKARKFGHEFCRQRSLSIQNQRLDSRAQDRRRFLAKNAGFVFLSFVFIFAPLENPV
jgi:Fe2+ transport system protein B